MFGCLEEVLRFCGLCVVACFVLEFLDVLDFGLV